MAKYWFNVKYLENYFNKLPRSEWGKIQKAMLDNGCRIELNPSTTTLGMANATNEQLVWALTERLDRLGLSDLDVYELMETSK